MLARSIEEMREVFLAMVAILRAAGTRGENIIVIKETLRVKSSDDKLRKLLEVGAALHLFVGYGQTLARRYVLTELGNLVATAIEQGIRTKDDTNVKALYEAFESLAEVYK